MGHPTIKLLSCPSATGHGSPGISLAGASRHKSIQTKARPVFVGSRPCTIRIRRHSCRADSEPDARVVSSSNRTKSSSPRPSASTMRCSRSRTAATRGLPRQRRVRQQGAAQHEPPEARRRLLPPHPGEGLAHKAALTRRTARGLPRSPRARHRHVPHPGQGTDPGALRAL